MAQTAYNASVAYNAPIRYDGITSDVVDPPTDQPTISFDPPRRRRPEAKPERDPQTISGTVQGISVSIATIVGVIDTSRAEREDLFLLDLI